MKYTKHIALSVVMLTSVLNTEAKLPQFTRVTKGIKKITRSTTSKTRNLATSQVESALKAVAQGADTLFYPAVIYMLGSHLYDKHVPANVKNLTPETVTNTVNQVPFGPEASSLFVRLVTGCVAVAGAHALVHTDSVGNFIDENMPHLSRAIKLVSAEISTEKKSSAKKSGI